MDVKTSFDELRRKIFFFEWLKVAQRGIEMNVKVMENMNFLHCQNMHASGIKIFTKRW